MYLFALAMTFLITSCGQKKGEDTALVRPVKTATVSSQSVILKDFSGMVEAVEYVKLAFRVSGQIINLPVVEGQRLPMKLPPRRLSATNGYWDVRPSPCKNMKSV